LTSSNSATSSISASSTTPPDIAAILREQADRQKADAASTSAVVNTISWWCYLCRLSWLCRLQGHSTSSVC
jgi:hypothetical protein